MSDDLHDWTTGTPRVLVSTCESCGHRWYLRRDRCPRCTGPFRTAASGGRGTVVATTRSDAGGIALVDLAEGVRVLGRCDPALQPGAAALLTFRAGPGDPVAVPYFEAESP